MSYKAINVNAFSELAMNLRGTSGRGQIIFGIKKGKGAGIVFPFLRGGHKILSWRSESEPGKGTP